MAALGSPSVEVVEIERCSSTLLVKLAMDAQGGSSGVPMAMHTWHVLEFRGDRVIHVQAFVDGDRARAAAA